MKRVGEILRDHLGRRNGLRVWRVVVTRCRNGSGAPFIVNAWTHGRDTETHALRWSAQGKTVSLVRGRNQYGERNPGPALFFGWAKFTSPREGES